MKIAIIGNVGSNSLEEIYASSLRRIGVNVELINQYVGVEHPTLYRLMVSRIRLMQFLASRLPINDTVSSKLRVISPDIVLVFKGECLSNRTITKITKEYGTFLYYPDGFRYKPLLQDRIAGFEAVITGAHNPSMYRDLGARRTLLLPWGFDNRIFKPTSTPKTLPVSFVGSPYLERYRVLRVIPNTHVFGGHWYLKVGVHHPPVTLEGFARVIASTEVNLNIQHPTDHLANQLAERAFDIAGAGEFLITDNIPCADAYLPGVTTYRNPIELRDAVSWYLDNPAVRQEKADRLADHCAKHHTYDLRAASLLEMIH